MIIFLFLDRLKMGLSYSKSLQATSRSKFKKILWHFQYQQRKKLLWNATVIFISYRLLIELIILEKNLLFFVHFKCHHRLLIESKCMDLKWYFFLSMSIVDICVIQRWRSGSSCVITFNFTYRTLRSRSNIWLKTHEITIDVDIAVTNQKFDWLIDLLNNWLELVHFDVCVWLKK